MEKIRLFGILHIIGNIIRKEIKMDVINEYEQVLIGNLPKIPPRLFQNEPSANEHLALSVFRYAIEKLLRWTPMEAYRLFPGCHRDHEIDTALKLYKFSN